MAHLPGAQQRRPIANLPHQHQRPQPPAPRVTPYTPDNRELYAGPRNRLFLALRSSIPSEVDWALPRLVVASFDAPDSFKLDSWVDSVGALKEWPTKWLEGLEKEAAAFELRQGRLDFADVKGEDRSAKRLKRDLVLSTMPEWLSDPAVEKRATNSLLILRNASFSGPNAKTICKEPFLAFLNDFFSLPIPFLQHLLLRSPEPVHHIFATIQSIFPAMNTEIPGIRRIFGEVFPRLLMESSDIAVANDVLPILIMGQTIPNITYPPELVPYLLRLLALRPPGATLDLVLDLITAFTLNPVYARQILCDPNFMQHLKSLAVLLDHNGQNLSILYDGVPYMRAKAVLNPAGGAYKADESRKRRTLEREWAQKTIDPLSGRGMAMEVGTEPPTLSDAAKKRLFAMKEPQRSIAWMHEVFVYSSTAQVLQVTFWHAYRDFFSGPGSHEPLLSASEVIKNVTAAFPTAAAKVWNDAMGNQKFVIAGVGFRKGSDDSERFGCFWRDCAHREGATNPAQLIEHIQSFHVPPSTYTPCQWGSCTHAPCTLSHFLTHIPLGKPIAQVPDYLSCYAGTSPDWFSRQVVTARLPPPTISRMSFAGKKTATDANRRPVGTPLLAALTVRNLARTLRTEITLALPEDVPTEDEVQAKKKHLLEERYGLPIPESVIKEEEKEQEEANQGAAGKEMNMSDEERERAKAAFESIEEKVERIMEENVGNIGHYLGDAFGW
ncbi:hypothetical protein I350_00205 [Cryptococcus amylolentus CBS 6273]|uniref:RFX-type winged-helix domain-containing protein n=1 Tax=Cryptococcus amylolentus CBS 6273 TaxID=1296118 RepID=A0A1E3KEI0_9TREE|nr:hypothetical protein I350_00205 [Cryptococcus amylolentus CBS 6273]